MQLFHNEEVKLENETKKNEIISYCNIHNKLIYSFVVTDKNCINIFLQSAHTRFNLSDINHENIYKRMIKIN